MRFAGHAAGVGLLLGGFSSQAAPQTVTLVGASPVVIVGTGYSAGAKFVVTYRSGSLQVRRHVVATLAGRYRVVLKGVAFKRCNGLQLAAPGASLRVASCAAGGRPAVTAQPGGLVSGSAFVPTERVALSALMGDLVVHASTTAGRGGAFTAQLPWPRAACTDIDVRAVGALGSTSSYTVAMPACRKPEMITARVAITLLHGTVRLGPTTPVCRVEVPCSKPAANAVLSFSRGRSQVQVRTDARGRYRVRLAPGTWTLTTRFGLRPTPIRFVVPRAASATRNFSIDTGIR